MKNQGFYRGGENKKVKLSKQEKAYNALETRKRRALILPQKKEATTT